MSEIERLINELCPNGVECKTLGELGEFYGGLSGKTKADFTGGNAIFVTYMNVFSNLSLPSHLEQKVKVGANEKQHAIKKGDVIFTGSSECVEECAMSSVMCDERSEVCYLNSFCFGFRFHDDKLMFPHFSKYLFRSDGLRNQLVTTASGVTRFNVSKKKMAKIKIPVPPIEVQREIVRILDNFTELTAELTAELDKRKKQYEYYRDTLLTFDNTVERKTLGEICEFRNGKGHERVIVPNGKYIVINSKFISTDGAVKKFANEQLTPLLRDEILIVMSDLPNGKALAKCFIVDIDFKYTLNQRIGAIKANINVVESKYLFYLINRNKQLLKYDNSVDQTNLKKDQILNILVPIPSLPEQQRIVDILDRFDSLCNDITKGLPAEIEARKKQYEYYRDKLLTFKQLNAEV